MDALIVTDIGVMMAARRIAPNLEIHISTQAGVTNYLAANALYELGAKRVVLAREMDLQAVRDIRANIPEDMDIECFVHGAMCMAANALYELGAKRVVLAREMDLQAVRDIRANIPEDMDIECFVHGAMCMAFSGRCLFSNYLTGRDGNHGECAQPCRWKYSIVEEKRPGRYFPIEQTQDGAYLFNSQDMNMLEHLDDLIDAGATSLKIEGRSKSAYYIAAMTNAYKSAVNEYMVQRGFESEDGAPLAPFHDRVHRTAPGESPRVGEAAIETDTPAPAPVNLPQWLREEPYKVAHRDYSTGFYYPEHPVTQNTDRSHYFREWLVVGETLGWSPEEGGRLTIMSRNKIEAGQLVEFVLPGRAPYAYTVPGGGFRDEHGMWVREINNPAHVFSMPCPEPIPVNAAMRSRTKQATMKAE